jgi:hypothetical protein
MLAEIGSDAFGGGPCGQRGREDEIRTEQVSRPKTFILPDSGNPRLCLRGCPQSLEWERFTI